MPSLRETLAGLVGPVAKAIAAFVTPFLVLAVAWLVEQTGVEVAFDPTTAETLITSVCTAILVWAIANRPKPTGEQ